MVLLLSLLLANKLYFIPFFDLFISWVSITFTNTHSTVADVVADFVRSIETHLFQYDQTVLVGDSLSIADVVVALLVAQAAVATTTEGTNAVLLPQQVHRWMHLVLHNLQRTVPSEILPLQTYIDAYPEPGTSSPLEKQTHAAPVPVSAAESAPTISPAAVPSEPTPAPAATPSAAVAPDEKTTTTTGSPASGDAKIKQLLLDFGIEHQVYDHAPCMTADELVTNVALTDSNTETHTKNLFLRDKKHGLFLVTVATSSVVSTKDLGTLLKLPGKSNLRLADAAILNERLHVQPGHVGPLCLGLVDNAKNTDAAEEKITLVLDQALVKKYTVIHSHPARNDQSVTLSPTNLLAFLSKVGVEPVIVELGTATVGASASSETKSATTPTTNIVMTKAEPATKKAVVADRKTAKKGETLLALQWKKDENFAMWYSDVIVLSEMISYYDISGCYILRPWSYKMWELIQDWFNVEIQKMGVENAYFPLFVSQERLEKEKDHVEGFAPEVAWVTKSGDGDLARPIAIRPTSETIMYPAYSDWIKSHRDLPLKLNQWSNVVRWEFKYPTPFLRTREFLWQEGHTAHSTFDDADETVMAALELYRAVYEDLLAVPVIPGYKTEKEKFAGGYRTTTVEAYVAGSGRAIQGATSHNLGQNFGKMFDIKFQDEKGESQIAWQTSWGLTTRTIGVMVMVHGDDTGLVLPPRIAPLQVVIVPIVSKNLTHEVADPYCLDLLVSLQAAGIRAKYDDRRIYNPGWKYNHWEQKGVPIRMEVGPRDIEQKSARIVIRHNGAKEDHPIDASTIGQLVVAKLVEIQLTMFDKAKAARDEHLVQVTDWKDFVPNLEKNNMVLTPWCGGEHQDWEQWVKDKSKAESLESRGIVEEDDKTSTSVAAKTLCIPFKQPDLPPDTKCIASGKDATCWVLWGRSY